MLLFTMFTLGYFFGVVITLKVFGQKDKVEGYQSVDNALNSEKEVTLSSWDIFTQLTKINHPKGIVGHSLDKQQRDLISSTESESGQKQTYATP